MEDKSSNITLRLPTDLIKQLNKEAKNQDRSRNYLVRTILERHCNRRKKK